MGISRHRDRRTSAVRWASTCEHWAVAICGNTAACTDSAGIGSPRGVRAGSSTIAWLSWIVGSTVMDVIPMRRRRQYALECLVCGGQWWWGCRTHRRTTSSSPTCAQLSRLAISAGRSISAAWSGWCPRRPCPRRPWSPHLRRHRRAPRLRRACPPAPPYLGRMATAAANGPAVARHFGVTRVRRLKRRRPRARRLWLRHPRLRFIRRRVRRLRARRLRVRRLRVRRRPRGRRCPAQRPPPPVLLILRCSADGVQAAG